MYSSGQGLNIVYLRPEYDHVASKDTIYIEAKVQNLGDRDIPNVTAVPYLLAWDKFTGEKSTTNPLLRPNPEIGRIGDVYTFKWDGIAVPEVKRQETFRIGVRFEYEYETETTATVLALTEAKYLHYRERGQPVQAVFSVVNSAAPIRVDVLMDNVFIIGSSNKIPVTLRFNNIDSKGYPKSSSSSELRDYAITSVDVVTDGAGGVKVSDKSGCDGARMRGGRTGECVLYLSAPGTGVDEIEARLKIVTKYTYVMEETAAIRVNPRIG
jgi:hypothetical protein